MFEKKLAASTVWPFCVLRCVRHEPKPCFNQRQSPTWRDTSRNAPVLREARTHARTRVSSLSHSRRCCTIARARASCAMRASRGFDLWRLGLAPSRSGSCVATPREARSPASAAPAPLRVEWSSFNKRSCRSAVARNAVGFCCREKLMVLLSSCVPRSRARALLRAVTSALA